MVNCDCCHILSCISVSFLFSAVHDYEKHVTPSEMGLRIVAESTEAYRLTTGGAFYSRGVISGMSGQRGPDLGIHLRSRTWFPCADRLRECREDLVS
jgi:hypothetical protein